MSAESFATEIRIAADHPCLPGHFPGRPLVPGVLLLQAVAGALAQWRGERLARVPEAKFVAPLLPGQTAVLELREAAGRVAFTLRREGQLLARGVVEGKAGE